MDSSLKSLLLWAMVTTNQFTTTLLPKLARPLTKNRMAVRSSRQHLSSISIPRFGTRKAALRFSTPVHSCNCNAHLSKPATSIKTVFEDQVRGVVCYKDDKGEVICEGYDEGPRFGTRLPEKACFPWPMGIQVTDFIEMSTLRVFEDVDVLQPKNDQKRQL